MNSHGATCDRCAATERELRHAVVMLEPVLEPLGFEPQLEIRELDAAAFAADPSTSNRIWVADRSLEEWIGASVGTSRCCSVCGDSDCRTLEVGKATFEAVPERLVVEAALRAVAELLDSPEPSGCACVATAG